MDSCVEHKFSLTNIVDTTTDVHYSLLVNVNVQQASMNVIECKFFFRVEEFSDKPLPCMHFMSNAILPASCSVDI